MNRHFFVQDTLTLLVHSITLFLPIHVEHRDQAHTQFPSFLLENLSILWLLIWTTYFFPLCYHYLMCTQFFPFDVCTLEKAGYTYTSLALHTYTSITATFFAHVYLRGSI